MSLPRNPLLRLASIALLLALIATSGGCITAEASRDTAVSPPAAPTASAGTTQQADTPEAATADPQPDPAPVATPDPAATLGLRAAIVVRVVDGDTAHLRQKNGVVEKVRFIGVDTPESTNRREPYGAEAAAYTKRALKPGRRVFLETDAELRDRYGRMLAYVWLSKPQALGDDGRPPLDEAADRMLNARLMRDGYAQVMTVPPNLMYQDYFLDLQREARSEDRGLWDLPVTGAAAAPTPSSAPSGGGTYIGNRNTMKFHYPSCGSVNQMNPANRVSLASRSAAVSAGYVPCKNCDP